MHLFIYSSCSSAAAIKEIHKLISSLNLVSELQIVQLLLMLTVLVHVFYVQIVHTNMVKLLFWVIFNRSALGIFCYSHWPTRTKPHPPNLLSSYKKFRCKNIKKQTIYSDIPLLLMFAHLIWSLVVLALKILLSFSETVKINNSDNVFVSPVYMTQFQWQMLILQKQFFQLVKKK